MIYHLVVAAENAVLAIGHQRGVGAASWEQRATCVQQGSGAVLGAVHCVLRVISSLLSWEQGWFATLKACSDQAAPIASLNLSIIHWSLRKNMT